MNKRWMMGWMAGCMGVGTMAWGTESATLWNSTGAGGYPQSVQPSPPDFNYTLADDRPGPWSTFNSTDLAQLESGTPVAGFQGPTLGQMSVLEWVPTGMQGTLESFRLSLMFRAGSQYDASHVSGGNHTIDGLPTSVGLTVHALENPSPVPDPFPASVDWFNRDVVASVKGMLIGPGVVASQSATGSATVPGTETVHYDFVPGADTGLDELGPMTPGGASLPVWFSALGTSVSSPQNGLENLAWGRQTLSLNYTLVPESDWAWVALPMVIGAWILRRRLQG